jgi:large subunit ribosomal protein L4
MPEVAVVNSEGAEVGKISLSSEVFEVQPHVSLMHRAVVAHLNNLRSGTSETLTRGEVRGGGKKPYRQKGTGRARQGTIRAPQYPGGGIVWGPHPRDYSQEMPKRMRRHAIRSALSIKVAEGQMVVVDDLKMDAISTKTLAAMLSRIGAQGKTILLLAEPNDTIYKSARNIPWLIVRIAPSISTYDLLIAEKIIVAKDAVAKLEEVRAK